MVSPIDTNFYAPAFKISINGDEIEPALAHSILTVRLEQELNKTNSFSFEVQDEFNAGRFKWLEKEMFRVANPVSVSLGYADRVVRVLEGKIQNVNASFHTGCAPTFT